MKKTIILVTLICISIVAKAQLPIQNLGVTGNVVKTRNTLKVDSCFVLPLRDTTFPTGQSEFQTGGMVLKSTLPYYYNGTSWVGFQVGASVDTTSLSNRINERVKYSDSNTVYVTQYGADTARVTLNSNIALKLNISDTTGKWVTAAYRSNDSVFVVKGGIGIFSFIDSVGTQWDTSYIYQALADTAAAIRADFPIFTGDTSALTTNTPMSSTLDTVQRNGINSSLLLGTLGAMVNGAFTTNQDANINGVNVGRGGGGISSNTRVGVNSLLSNTTGFSNNANGYYSLYSNTTGISNNASGYYSLYSNTTGNGNNANGYYSLYSNTTGIANNASGSYSLFSNTTGDGNNANGYNSLYSNTTGISNNASGYNSGRYITGGAIPNTQTDNSVYIGAFTKAQADSQTNQIVIGYDATGLGSNSAILGNSSISLTALRGSVLVNTTTNISCSQLTVESVSKGFLPPRMTTMQKNAIGSPTAGLLVYDLNLNKMCVYSTQWDTISTQNIIFGTGVQTALGINVGTVGSILVNGGALGTPSSGNGANLTGIPQSGVTNLVTDLAGKQSTITFGTGVQAALGVNIGSAGAPVLFNGAGGTPSSMTGTNITGIPQSGVTNLASDLALKAPLASPALTGTPTAPTAIAGTNTTQIATTAFVTTANATNANLTGPITSVGNATSIASQTGTGSTFVVSASPTITGTTTLSNTTDITLAGSSALQLGGAANSTNMTGGEYSTGTAWQSRNNGAVASMFLNPFGGDLRYGDASVTGGRLFMISNPSAGTGSFAGWEVRNGTTNSGEALVGYTLGTAFTTSGMNVQDAGVLRTGTALSGGLSIGTQASADLRFYSNNTQWYTLLSGGDFVGVSTGGFGYGTGAGGVVTQATSKATGCTLNELSGQITMNGAALAAGTIVSFTFTNSTIDATDVMILNHTTTGTLGAYTLNAQCNAGTATITIRNNTAGSLSEAVVIRYAVIKASNN